ncbi:MAG: hypothetical protein ACOX2Z_00080 [Minisyncoccales bacterium]
MQGLWKKLQGIASDDKPVDDINGTLRIGNGSEFYELDTLITLTITAKMQTKQARIGGESR